MATEAHGTSAGTSTNDYDKVLYPGGSHVETWPDRLAAMAVLLGMEPGPAPSETCRVLEIGCGEGGNLIPMALGLPGARLVGIDLARRPVEIARERAKAVGVGNAEFRQMDLADVGPGLGEFDYVIAHGVYSWVPDAVRERLLAVCRANLSPNGVAFVSYNALPGGSPRQMARSVAHYHLAQLDPADPAAQVAETRALIGFLAEVQFAQPHERAAYRAGLREEMALMAKLPDGVVFHDTIAEQNRAFYFHEFVAAAGRHGLRFLGESSLPDVMNPHFPPALRQRLEQLLARLPAARQDEEQAAVLREQYADLVKGTAFRQTLLCRAEARADRRPTAQRVRGLWAGGQCRFEPRPPDVGQLRELVRSPAARMTFTGPPGVTASSDSPLMKAALVHLSRSWPRFLPFDEVVESARAHSGAASADREQDARQLADTLLGTAAAKLVELRFRPPRLTTRAGPNPVASPVARRQAADAPDAILVNLVGQNVQPPAGSTIRRLLPLLDGSRDREALVDALLERVRSGELTVEDNGAPVRDEVRLRPTFRTEVERGLSELAVNGLLLE